MVGRKDIFEYAKTFFILAICFWLIGNYFYVENFTKLINNYNYHDEPMNSLFNKDYNNFVLEGGHEYRFYFFFEGPQGANLNINMIFETMDNITLSYGTGAEKTVYGVWGENSVYTEPLYILQNETINIRVRLTTSSLTEGLHWQMLVYQDLPIWLTKSIPITAFFTILLLVIWVIAYEQYEKVFHDFKKQNRNLVEKPEEVTNVE